MTGLVSQFRLCCDLGFSSKCEILIKVEALGGIAFGFFTWDCEWNLSFFICGFGIMDLSSDCVD